MEAVERVIWKWAVTAYETQRMPQGAEILHAQVVDGTLFVWALVDPSAELVDRYLTAHVTGGRGPGPLAVHIGTVINNGIVWHFFDDGEGF